MRRVLLILVVVMMPSVGRAQNAGDRDAVLKTVQAFFDTMTARDVEGARKILIADGRFQVMDLRKPGSEPRSFTNEE